MLGFEASSFILLSFKAAATNARPLGRGSSYKEFFFSTAESTFVSGAFDFIDAILSFQCTSTDGEARISGTTVAVGEGLLVKVLTTAISAVLPYVGVSFSLLESRLSTSSAVVSFEHASSQGARGGTFWTPAATSLSTANLETEGLPSELSLNLLMYFVKMSCNS